MRIIFLASLAIFTMFPYSAWACLGCGPAYTFCTRAEYEAPKMGYVIKVLGAGTVQAGHDLSDDFNAVAMVCPMAGSSGKPIRLRLTGAASANYAVVGGVSGIITWTFQDKPNILERIFRAAGFGKNWADEIAETMRVFENISLGPKGTIMPGQSKFLKVHSVDFQREKCDEQSPNKWIEQSLPTLGCSS